MTQAVRPQDDLYAHVNAEWFAQATIPDDQSIHGAMHELRDRAEEACRVIVQECAAAPGAPGSPTQLIGDLYGSFMDTDTIEAAGCTPIADALAAAAAVPDVTGLFRLLGRLQRTGVSGLFGYSVDNDADDPDRYQPHLYQGGLSLPDESYYSGEEHTDLRAKYLLHIERMFALAGLPDPAGSAAAVLLLETEIAGGHWDRTRNRDRTQTHNPMDAAGLAELWPATWWESWVDGLGGGPASLGTAEVMQPSFFTDTADLLVAERLDHWRLWLQWKVIRSFAPFGPQALVDQNFDFHGRTLSGTPVLRERWKRGVSLVEGAVGEALGEVYVQRHFAPEAKGGMDALVGHLLAAYAESIQGLDWMTEETKQRALAKLATFRPKIGYPDTFRDYSSLVVDRKDLWGNVSRATAAEWQREQEKLGAPVDRDEWFMTPQTVNAYYNPGFNEIVFPAAILQQPFYAVDQSPAENFGAIGAVIGHEIGHGFDDQGSKYDGTGALRDWWTADDRSAFEALTHRLVEQYNALSPDGAEGRTVNGALTIGENIGDLGGLGIGFRAWRISGLGDPDDPEQARAFFDSWARAWRTITRPEEVQRRLVLDPHSPPEFRCNQVVRNLDEFYTAYDVRPGDGMWLDPADRVRIW